MLHRRLLRDDGYGVGEPLNETAFDEGLVVRGSHFIFNDEVNDLLSFGRRFECFAMNKDKLKKVKLHF